MPVRVAINGFGRIGRLTLRAIYESGRSDIKVLAINDLAPVDAHAHLLRYDSSHGPFPGTVRAFKNVLGVGKDRIKVFAERDPAALPWGKLGADIILECTGLFADRDKAATHLTAGAKRVLVSAPASGAELTVAISTARARVIDFHDAGGVPNEFSLATAWKNGGLMHVHARSLILRYTAAHICASTAAKSFVLHPRSFVPPRQEHNPRRAAARRHPAHPERDLPRHGRDHREQRARRHNPARRHAPLQQ